MRAPLSLQVAASMVLVASGALAQKTPDTMIHGGPRFTNAALGNVVADGSLVGVAWMDLEPQAQYAVRFRRSLDAGLTWEPESVLSGPLDGNRIDDVAMTMSGDAMYAVWIEESDPVYFVFDLWLNRSLDRGATWLPAPVRLNTDQVPAVSRVGWPQVAASGTTAHVVWSDYISGVRNVMFTTSTDAGTTWAGPLPVNTSKPPMFVDSDFPQIAVSGNNIHVLYKDNRDGDRNVHYNRSSEGGATWLASDKRLTPVPDSGIASFPQIAVAGSSVVAVWEQSGNLFMNRSSNGGRTWLPAQVDLSSPGYFARGARLWMEGSRVFVVWSDQLNASQPAHVYLLTSADGGSNWSPVLQIDGLNGDAESPVLAYEAGVLHVAWIEDRIGSETDIYYNRSLDDGQTWLASDLRLDTDLGGVGESFSPLMATGDEQAYVVWMDDRVQDFSFFDLYFNLPFGAQPIGAGSLGSGGFVPLLDVTGPFTIGSAVSVQVSQGLGGAAGQLYYGFSGSTVIPLCGGAVYIQPPLFHIPVALSGPAGVPGQGARTLSGTLPPDPSLIGLDLTLQALLYDPGVSCGYTLTNGLALWVG